MLNDFDLPFLKKFQKSYFKNKEDTNDNYFKMYAKFKERVTFRSMARNLKNFDLGKLDKLEEKTLNLKIKEHLFNFAFEIEQLS